MKFHLFAWLNSTEFNRVLTMLTWKQFIKHVCKDSVFCVLFCIRFELAACSLLHSRQFFGTIYYPYSIAQSKQTFLLHFTCNCTCHLMAAAVASQYPSCCTRHNWSFCSCCLAFLVFVVAHTLKSPVPWVASHFFV